MEINTVLLRYPGIEAVETKSKQITFRGTVKIKENWYCLQVSCPHFPQLTGMQLRVQQCLEITTITDAHKCVQADWTISDLFENLPNMLSKEQNKTPDIDAPPQQNIYAEVAALYAPSLYQLHVNNECTRIRFLRFTGFEQHHLELELPSLLILSHSLPDCVPWAELLGKYVTLTTILQQFQNYLEDLRPFYENFSDIDELCYVVQPPVSERTKTNWRLFLLRERVYIKLLIADPFAPVASMSVTIIGPTNEVETLRRTYSEGLRDWDAELDIPKNLLRIFDLCFFPMAQEDGENESARQFCNICYCYQLERGEVPIVSCDNPHCSLIYHAACLREWFNTLSDGKVFLDVSFGACPFCKAKLSTSFAELLEN